MKVKGFAVVHEGAIDIRTVSDTSSAAKINWLVCYGWMVLAKETDETIHQKFEQYRGISYVTPVEVASK